MNAESLKPSLSDIDCKDRYSSPSTSTVTLMWWLAMKASTSHYRLKAIKELPCRRRAVLRLQAGGGNQAGGSIQPRGRMQVPQQHSEQEGSTHETNGRISSSFQSRRIHQAHAPVPARVVWPKSTGERGDSKESCAITCSTSGRTDSAAKAADVATSSPAWYAVILVAASTWATLRPNSTGSEKRWTCACAHAWAAICGVVLISSPRTFRSAHRLICKRWSRFSFAKPFWAFDFQLPNSAFWDGIAPLRNSPGCDSEKLSQSGNAASEIDCSLLVHA